MWRCTASLDTDISTHTHGKWFNTTYPSQELSGTGEGRTWDENPPYVGQTFVLVHEHGGAYYEVLTPADSGELVGGDADCTGVKDDAASATWYATQS